MSDAPFRQLSSLTWPSGRDHAVGWIRLSPADLSSRAGVAFTEDVDDLDSFMAAALQLGSGRTVLLMNRPMPDYGLDVYADEGDSGPSVMAEVAEALKLADKELMVFGRSLGQAGD